MLKKVLKKFKTKQKSLDYSQISKIQIETKNLQNKLDKFNKEKEIIQSQFNFIIPDYLIDEIIESNTTKIYYNLNCLINCAIINGTLSKENGSILKQAYL